MDDTRQLQKSLPAELQQALGNADVQRVRGGCSGVHLYLVSNACQPDRYLKIASREIHRDLRPEAERLRWLWHKLPVPEVYYYGEDAGRQFLYISGISGIDTSSDAARAQPLLAVRLLATGLRLIHSVDAHECPFDHRLDVTIEAVRQRIALGLIDEHDLSTGCQGRSVLAVFDELLATRPTHEDLVFVHGDYCLPNIMVSFQEQRVTGFVDWGDAGVADRHQDLALCQHSIKRNLGSQWVEPFFAAYGLSDVDEGKVRFYKLLNEFT